MRSAAKFFLPLLLAPACLSGPAQAATCQASALATCNLIENNVQFSNFSFTGYNPSNDDEFELSGFSNGAGIVTLNFKPERFTATVGSFTYTVTLLPTPLFYYTFNAASASANAPFLNDGSTVTTSLASSGLLVSALYTKTGQTAGSNLVAFNPQLRSQIFTQSFNINPASPPDRVTAVSGLWNARANPVPGPLPLLGAATAFGLSRKLRCRIRSAG